MKKSAAYIQIILLTVFSFIIAFTVEHFAVSMVRAEGESMYPSVQDGDIVFALHWKNFSRDDVILVEPGDGSRLIKRLVGIPGDHLSVENGHLIVNGQVRQNIYMQDPGILKGDGITLGKDEYFILGDNCQKSYDSRYSGPIHKKNIKAVVIQKKRH